MTTNRKPHVVVIGGGFAGLLAVRTLSRYPVSITLIDRKNHHTFQPLLYQVATAGLSPGEIAAPIRWILRGHPDVQVLLGEVQDFDLQRRVAKLLAVSGGLSGGIGPGDLQAADVGRRNLAGAGKALAAGIAAIEGPIDIRRRRGVGDLWRTGGECE